MRTWQNSRRSSRRMFGVRRHDAALFGVQRRVAALQPAACQSFALRSGGAPAHAGRGLPPVKGPGLFFITEYRAQAGGDEPAVGQARAGHPFRLESDAARAKTITDIDHFAQREPQARNPLAALNTAAVSV